MLIQGILEQKNPRDLAVELKKGSPQKIFDEAIQMIAKDNENIVNRNNARSCIVKWLDPILNYLTRGRISLLEKTRDSAPIHDHIKKIKLHLSALTLQRKWRFNLRNKLAQRRITFEEFCLKAIKKRGLSPIEQAFAIKNFYSETHYAFTHGMGLPNWAILFMLNKAIELFKPESVLPHHLYFRMPGILKRYPNIDVFLKENQITNDHDSEVRPHLLSVDANLHSTTFNESAQHFYKQNQNEIIALPREALLKLLPDREIVDHFLECIHVIASPLDHEPSGNLFVILIPRPLQDDEKSKIAYASKPYGIPVKDQTSAQLEYHQRNPSSGYHQYRLVLSAMEQKRGIRIFCKNDLPKQREQELKARIENEISLFYAYSILVKLERPLTQEEEDKVIEILQRTTPDKHILDKLTKNPFLSQDQILAILNTSKPPPPKPLFLVPVKYV